MSGPREKKVEGGKKIICFLEFKGGVLRKPDTSEWGA